MDLASKLWNKVRSIILSVRQSGKLAGEQVCSIILNVRLIDNRSAISRECITIQVFELDPVRRQFAQSCSWQMELQR